MTDTSTTSTTTTEASLESASLLGRISRLVQDPQFYWWCGHVCLFSNALLHFTSVLSLHDYAYYYKRAYAGALVSYAIVIWKTIGFPRRFDMEFVRDENVQYFALAFYWYSYQPVTVTLIPFFIFSLFHALAYISSTLIPAFAPTNSTTQHMLKSIKQYTDQHHETAMQAAAYAEVAAILSRLGIGVITFQTSILALIVFTHFLRLRYYLSSYTREAIHSTTARVDEWLLPGKHASVPPFVARLYLNLKGIVIRYGSASTPASTPRNSTVLKRSESSHSHHRR
ncbi:hypothetical protein BCR43DRAFT_490577 [Syncephalastrum racemosum]|uniref:Uncharacterized protein n=1 Tax=Syncephalastrum racemosum TaxID=13706 RepID=A0A1X2HHM5_SYNRA|nr:hypothetical protein BCR43DRAFT_490577 [Syncephalastrum racemosum]